MTYQVIIPVLVAFAITAVLGPVIIPFLRKLKIGNTEREELESHQKKNGTPTMGGIMILIAVVVTSLFYVKDYPQIIPVLFVTVGFGIIGFLDDYLKVVLRRSDGLLAWQKMLCEIVVTAVFAVYLIKHQVSLDMIVPFSHHMLQLSWLAVPILFLAVIGTVNGALLGFLLFNVYPASVFMGDTGSLALGGFVAATAYMMQMPIFILIVGLIYWIEILSVMIQVVYFKKTGGKRFFRMAPIHHHFELGGWSETRVVAVFSIVTAILCLIAYIGIAG